MLEISHNATSIFRGCPKKYYWTYVQGLSPKRKSNALTLGSAIHEAFELYAKGTSDTDVIAHLITTFDEQIAKATEYEVEDLEVNKATAIGMWMHYPWKDRSEFQENYPEMKFKIRINGLNGVRFVGRIDGLVKTQNKWWLREVKTTGLTPRQFQNRIALSSQATGYVYALKKMGYDIQGVMYDMIKKPRLKKGVNEDCRHFCDRIVSDYLNDQKMPENARKAYLRPFVYRSSLQLRQFEEDTRTLVRKIRHTLRKNEWYRNQDLCWNYNSLCPFEKVCFMETPDKLTLEAYYDR